MISSWQAIIRGPGTCSSRVTREGGSLPGRARFSLRLSFVPWSRGLRAPRMSLAAPLRRQTSVFSRGPTGSARPGPKEHGCDRRAVLDFAANTHDGARLIRARARATMLKSVVPARGRLWGRKRRAGEMQTSISDGARGNASSALSVRPAGEDTSGLAPRSVPVADGQVGQPRVGAHDPRPGWVSMRHGEAARDAGRRVVGPRARRSPRRARP